ncbi:MAG: hypothetical protein ACUVSF_00085 [Anaerolineae bacterium]
MEWRECYPILRDQALNWLLEEENPSARYLALRQLSELPSDAPEVQMAQCAIPNAPPALHILEAQYPTPADSTSTGSYWIRPDAMYSPRHRATMWQVIFLAQLGMPPIPALQCACEHILERGRRASDGRFIAGHALRAAFHCLNGILLWAFQQLGYTDDPRMVQAREAMAFDILQHGFACPNNKGLPCAWGAVKVLRAFLDVQVEKRTPKITAAIERGVELLLSTPLRQAAYPAAEGAVSALWFALTFPLTCHADLLEAMTILALAGYSEHPYMRDCVPWLLDKQIMEGRWALEHTPSKTWASFGEIGRANKWVTLRALYALKLFHLSRWTSL